MHANSTIVKIRNGPACFFGEVQDAFPHGYGIMHTPEFTYDGNFQHGRFHGIGALNVKNKYYYRGNFVSGYFQNHGYLIRCDDDSEYEGQFMTGRMNGFGRLKTRHFTFEGYFAGNQMRMGLYQEAERKLKFLGTFEHNHLKSGTLWAFIGGQQIKIQSIFDQNMVAGQQGLITTRRNQIFYDGWKSTRQLDVFAFLANLMAADPEVSIQINCKKTYSRQASFYVGATRNLVPDGEGILYTSSQNCFVGSFAAGKLAAGHMEIKMGAHMFMAQGGCAKLGQRRLRWLDDAQQTEFASVLGLTGNNDIVLNYIDDAARLNFLGRVEGNKAQGQCLLQLGSNILDAEFAGGYLSGVARLQQGSIFQTGAYVDGRKNGLFHAILGRFAYQFWYREGRMLKYALLDTGSQTAVLFDCERNSGIVVHSGAVRIAYELDRSNQKRCSALLCVQPGVVFRRVLCGMRYDLLLEALFGARDERIALRRGAWLLELVERRQTSVSSVRNSLSSTQSLPRESRIALSLVE